MWMVYDQIEGLVSITDDEQEALRCYEKQKKSNRNYVQRDGEFQGVERVILALIKKDFFCHDTGKSEVIYYKDNNKVYTGGTYRGCKGSYVLMS
ncbi:hypothetical protein [Brevibacillus laterosporus]|uniref:hypothetical protein n=1 Tax=Brevibacillus laterosporus TaxID=1465 RepID=UPI000B9A2D62|nr:hypothetical protein [Brevibacillus laterosporus]